MLSLSDNSLSTLVGWSIEIVEGKGTVSYALTLPRWEADSRRLLVMEVLNLTRHVHAVGAAVSRRDGICETRCSVGGPLLDSTVITSKVSILARLR